MVLPLKTGRILHSFSAKDSRKVILRTPRWEDVDDLLELINSLIEEGADIPFETKKTREEEVDWLAREMAQLEKGAVFLVVAEVDGKVVASADISKGKFRCMSHLGDLGIAIKSGYRDLGIGTEMMKFLLGQAREMGLKVLTLRVFSTNERAQHVYRKAGFKEVGRVPKAVYRNGKYIDDIIMALEF